MPLLYGEGTRAFTRLVEQKTIGSDDHSIFAIDHKLDPAASGSRGFRLLPDSPESFTHAGDDIPIQTPGRDNPYAMTNEGLRITLDLTFQRPLEALDRRIALLNAGGFRVKMPPSVLG